MDNYSVDGVCGHCNTVLEAMGRYYLYCPCQKSRPFLTEEKIQCSIKKRARLREQYIQEKGYNVIEIYEYN